MTTAETSAPELERRTIRKVALRLLPFLGLLYFINYLDRTNIGFAKLTMSDDLGLTQTAFGLASGIFFIGYLLLEVPSNLALHRFGARRWIARIMITWGIVASAMAFVPNEGVLYVLRFLLGVAEAGFFPGIILYLTFWFPKRERAKVVAWFMVAIPISTVLGSPDVDRDHAGRARPVRVGRLAGDVLVRRDSGDRAGVHHLVLPDRSSRRTPSGWPTTSGPG